MHQEHNIAWNTLASHMKFIRDNPQLTPRRTDIFAQRRPDQAKALTYFKNSLINTISTFAETERAKYTPTDTLEADIIRRPPQNGKLYPDSLLDKYPEFLNPGNQLLENWIAAARANGLAGVNHGYPPFAFNTANGDLADVVKILIHENQMESLLMLAHHPMVPLKRLHNLSWGHHFGWSRVMESCMTSYIFINMSVAMGILVDGRCTETSFGSRMLSYLTSSMDYDGQQVPHREFFQQSQREWGKDTFTDLEKVKKYMKHIFAMLYRYYMLAKECGVDVGVVDREVVQGIGWMTAATTNSLEMDGKWVDVFV